MDIEIVKNEYGTMVFHQDSKILHHQWHKFIYGDVMHEMLLKGTEAMKKYGGKKWLSDDRKNPILRKEDMDWGQVNWFPQTLKAGWKYWAIVTPEGAIAKINMEKLVVEYGKAGVVAKYFTNPEDALAWLKEQP